MNDSQTASSYSTHDSNTLMPLWTLSQAIMAILIWLLLQVVYNMLAEGVYKVIGETHQLSQMDFIGFYVPLVTVCSQVMTFIYWQAWMSYFALMNQCSFKHVRNVLGLGALGRRQMLQLLSMTLSGLVLTSFLVTWLQKFVPIHNHNPHVLEQLSFFLSGPLISRLPLILMIVVTAPFFEELAFRGILQPSMIQHFGVRTGIFLTTLIFTGAHAHYYQSPFLMADIFCISLLLCWLRLHSNSLWPCIFAHAFHNTIALYSLGK